MDRKTYELERTNLEAHVDLCAERYRVLEEKVNRVVDRLDKIDHKFEQMRIDNTKAHQNNTKALIGAAATVLASVIGIIAVLLSQ